MVISLSQGTDEHHGSSLSSLELQRLLDSDPLVLAGIPDAAMLNRYLQTGSPAGSPIPLAIGESWTSAPEGLIEHLRTAPRFTHGYQLSMFGDPTLRSIARERVLHEHRIRDVMSPNAPFDVAITTTGTRAAMDDFGCYLVDQLKSHSHSSSGGKQLVALAAGPSWDYEGVVARYGFEFEHVMLRAEDGFVPHLDIIEDAVARVLADPEKRLGLVVINAQHNPTARNWPPDVVRALIRAALRNGGGVLLDDAYFGVYDERIEPTSALRILLEELDEAPTAARERWLAVRSLGKQFRCNGWGVGVVTAAQATLVAVMNEIRFRRTLTMGGPQEYAMARWWESEESDRFLHEQRQAYMAKRAFVASKLVERLGHPVDVVQTPECCSVALIAVPRRYRIQHEENASRVFRQDCLMRTGVLLAEPWMASHSTGAEVPYVRMYLGPNQSVLDEAIERIATAGMTYDMDDDSRNGSDGATGVVVGNVRS